MSYANLAKPRIETLMHDLSETTRQIVARRAVKLADGLDASLYSVSAPAVALLGRPIVVHFTAPPNHPAVYWIGLYPHRGRPYAVVPLPSRRCPRRLIHAGSSSSSPSSLHGRP